MIDQASQLRLLARQWAAADNKSPLTAPQKIVVSAGKPSVGATTVAVNLAVAMGRLGCRTILVDADLSGADAASLCGIKSRETIADVLRGRRTVHEVLQPGPAGIQIVPGVSYSGATAECSPKAQERLLRELDQLGRHADVIVIDAGAGLTPVVQRFWQAAAQVLLVTTHEAVSIMDGYAAVKLFSDGGGTPRVQTIVNQAPQPEMAAEVHARIAEACEKFLSLTVTAAGAVAWDAAVALSARRGKPLVLDQPQSPAAVEIARMAEQFISDSQALPAADAKRGARRLAA